MRASRTIVVLFAAALLASCGGGNSGGPGNLLMVEKWPPSGDNQTDTVGQTLPKVLRVKVTLDGNTVAGYTVHFAGGNLGTPTVVTGADGIATTTWTLNGNVGLQLVTASVDSAQGSPLTFHATAVTGAAAAIVKVSGDSQVAVVNTNFGAPIVARVVDAFGNGVVGRWVYFSDSGLVTRGADSIISGDQGQVSLNVHANGSAGDAVILASADPLTNSPLVFRAKLASTLTTINVSSNAFTPDSVSIPAGSAVTWNWVSGSHSVTPDSIGAFEGSAVQSSPSTYGPLLFATPGVYHYHCSVHAGMTGTIKVN